MEPQSIVHNCDCMEYMRTVPDKHFAYRRFVLENVRAWADLNSVTRRADAILDAMPSPWTDDEKE